MAQQECKITLTVLYDDAQHTPEQIEDMLLDKIHESVNDGAPRPPRKPIQITYVPLSSEPAI